MSQQESERQKTAAETPEVETEVTAAAADDEAGTGSSSTAIGDQEVAEDLQALVEDARAKAEEHWGQLLRVRAELDNLRKRHERELESARKYALESFVGGLLPVRDSLELGNQAAQEETASVEKLREGTELTLKLLGDVMSKFGVEQIDPEGQPFDPDYHQAMSVQPRDDVPPNTVTVVIQKGYTLNGRLVRPALVMVSAAANA